MARNWWQFTLYVLTSALTLFSSYQHFSQSMLGSGQAVTVGNLSAFVLGYLPVGLFPIVSGLLLILSAFVGVANRKIAAKAALVASLLSGWYHVSFLCGLFFTISLFMFIVPVTYLFLISGMLLIATLIYSWQLIRAIS